MGDELVLVTGASGYLGTQVVKTLQEAGYRVRGTVRSVKNEAKVKPLYELCPGAKHKLELVEADLMKPDSWTGAVSGCTYVHHVASPFPLTNPRSEDELVKPAVEGTLSVLRACVAAGTVKRVVLTSSLIAIAERGGNTTPFDESTWADPNAPNTSFYGKSKIHAERAAWDFVKDLQENEKFELAVVNPVLIAGPQLQGTPGSSTEVISRLLTRGMPAIPRFNFSIIDVRDCALAHLKCMTVPEAAGNRHILSSGSMWYNEIAEVLDKEFRSQGYNVPTTVLPGFLVSVVGFFDKAVKIAKDFASKETLLDTGRMRNVLGIKPIPIEQTLIDMGYSLIENGFVPKTDKYRGPQQSNPPSI
ncbi:putative anthocyanidin reductase [Aplysia californica]|uniref:Anthocyanidin reductase n=1 Tax=Aplysia californica TaxID=6500 RepID=A0ABM1ADB8_APLCA|nr:putative anthocyanidin reductase [Aplysia californica]